MGNRRLSQVVPKSTVVAVTTLTHTEVPAVMLPCQSGAQSRWLVALYWLGHARVSLCVKAARVGSESTPFDYVEPLRAPPAATSPSRRRLALLTHNFDSLPLNDATLMAPFGMSIEAWRHTFGAWSGPASRLLSTAVKL
jgi:hypothetical protein